MKVLRNPFIPFSPELSPKKGGRSRLNSARTRKTQVDHACPFVLAGLQRLDNNRLLQLY